MKTNGRAATLEALARAEPQKVTLREPEWAVTYETLWSENHRVSVSAARPLHGARGHRGGTNAANLARAETERGS